MLNDNEAEPRTLRAVIGEKRLLVDPRQIQSSVRSDFKTIDIFKK